MLTPPDAHLDIAERCLRAGKHVLVEKPLEVTVDRAEQLVHAARLAKRKIGVVLQHRFRPSSRRLRDAIDAGELGTITAAWMLVLGGGHRPTTMSLAAGRCPATAAGS